MLGIQVWDLKGKESNWQHSLAHAETVGHREECSQIEVAGSLLVYPAWFLLSLPLLVALFLQWVLYLHALGS